MKRIIIAHLASIIVGVIAVSLAISFFIQIKISFDAVTKTADGVFVHIEQLVEQNNEELEIAREEHRERCVTHARAAASIIQSSPDMVYDKGALEQLARSLGVDEIHIFDASGTIISGTVPQYYGYNFHSGDQMEFFSPMVERHVNEMVQDITPNTAEGKEMQYAAAWCPDGSYIVQIGMEPHRLLNLLDSYDISHVFSMVTVASRTTVFAVGLEDGMVKGSNIESYNGLDAKEWGVPYERLSEGDTAFFARIGNNNQFCVARPMDGNIAVVRAVPFAALMEPVWSNTLIIFCYVTVVSALLVFLIVRFLDRRIVRGIKAVNDDLECITQGDYDTVLREDSTPEFVELSEHVNSMVNSITAVTGKLSTLLEGMDIPAGVFEYAPKAKRVRATTRVHEALGMTRKGLERLMAQPSEFARYIESIQAQALEEGVPVCQIPGEMRYVYIETVKHDGVITGVVFDMTEEVLERRMLEHTSTVDYLTELGNRRSFFDNAAKVMAKGAQGGYGFLAAVDADGLKYVNDQYGHGEGDRYLKTLAGFLRAHSTGQSVLARMGGDEFALLRYGFATQDEAEAVAARMIEAAEDVIMAVSQDCTVPVRFSIGVAYFEPGSVDVRTLLEEADAEMYRAKRERKAALIAGGGSSEIAKDAVV